MWDAWWNGCDIKGIWRRVVSSRDVVDTESACAPAMVPRKVVHELSLYQELEIELYSELVREWKTDINDVNMKGDMLEDDVNDNVINLTDTLLDVDVREVHVGNHNKLRSYVLFKSEVRMEAYLKHVVDVRVSST